MPESMRVPISEVGHDLLSTDACGATPIHSVENQTSSSFVWSRPASSLTSSQSCREIERLSSSTFVGRDDTCESLIYLSSTLNPFTYSEINIPLSDVKRDRSRSIANLNSLAVIPFNQEELAKMLDLLDCLKGWRFASSRVV